MSEVTELVLIERRHRPQPPDLDNQEPLCPQFEHPEKDEAVRQHLYRFLPQWNITLSLMQVTLELLELAKHLVTVFHVQ